MVAHYGPKKQNLARFIRALQKKVKEGLGRKYSRVFKPYRVEQVHATLVGMEGGPGGINRNFNNALEQRKRMDFEGLLRFIQNTNIFPMRIQFGRIFPFRDYGFKTSNEHPADWTFRFREAQVIVIGWPAKRGSSLQDPLCQDLELFRRAVQSFGIRHKFHEKPGDYDNDFYMVLGTIDRARITKGAMSQYAERTADLEQKVRRELMVNPPLRIKVGMEDISVVKYEDSKLPVRGTTAYPIINLSASQIQSLFG